MRQEEIGGKLLAHIIKKYKTQTAAAATWGVSNAFVSAVVCGDKRPNKAMLDDMGYERVTTPDRYRKKREVTA